jgi:hypothetical protein
MRGIQRRDADGKTFQLWLDDDVALRNAAVELRDALEALVEGAIAPNPPPPVLSMTK